MVVSIESIQRKIEILIDSSLINKLNIILESINDWPIEIDTLDEFCEKVELFLGKNPTKKNIDLILKNINLKEHAWESEALFQLTLLFDFYEDGINLHDIVVDLNNELSK